MELMGKRMGSPPEEDFRVEPSIATSTVRAATHGFSHRLTGASGRRSVARWLTVSSVAQLEDVLMALQAPRISLRDALRELPPKPGLYAIHGDELTWTQLRLAPPPDDRPLYVGKAEDSLVKRDLETHFGDGRTGSSTVRRSFAALLRSELSLLGMPRNPQKPGYFSSYGLSPADDAKLTRWMRDRLEIAVWPTDGSRALADIESDVLRRWNPAINITGVDHRWRSFLQAQRKVMAEQAKAWKEEVDLPN